MTLSHEQVIRIQVEVMTHQIWEDHTNAIPDTDEAHALGDGRDHMPLGWAIGVSRFSSPPPTDISIEELSRIRDASRAQKFAVWQAGLGGLNWIDALVAAGQAVKQGNGYPYTYFVRARDVTPYLANPPGENVEWRTDPGDILGEGWLGRTTIDHEAAKAIEPDEWLYVTAWDES